MRYSLNIMWVILLAACVLSFCDAPVLVSFDSPSISSPFEQALQQTMHVWSDIRDAASLAKYINDDYIMLLHAIIGQLVCIEHVLQQCDATTPADDMAYLARVLAMVKQEALTLSATQTHMSSMHTLFTAIEQLCQTDDTAIGSR